jgi:DNA-binding transcriptional ArsR family regulator
MATFSRQARWLKTLGHPTRLRMLHLLEPGEACVCHLSAALDLGQPVVSQHLMALRRTGAVTSRREGKNVYYQLATPEIPGLLSMLSEMAGGTPNLERLRPAENCPCPSCQAAHERPGKAAHTVNPKAATTSKEQ